MIVIEEFEYKIKIRKAWTVLDEIELFLASFHDSLDDFQFETLENNSLYIKVVGKKILILIKPFSQQNRSLLVVYLRSSETYFFNPREGPWIRSDLSFNLNHSGELTSYGTTKTQNFGEWIVEQMMKARIPKERLQGIK